MICKKCQERKFKKILKDSEEAMKRFTKKLKEEKKCRIQANKKEIDLKEK